MPDTKKLLVTFFSIFIFFSILSCSYSKLRVKPLSKDSFWDSGKEYLYKSNEKLEIAICFEKTINNQIEFFVEITNLDTIPVLIDPSQFYYKYTLHKKLSIDSTHSIHVMAKNPENEIDNIDKKIANENTAYETKQALNTACLFTGCLLSLTTISDKTEEEWEDEHETMESILDNMSQDTESHTNTVAYLENQKSRLEFDTIRKTTLFQNQTISGLLKFPLKKHAKGIKIILPVDNNIITFEYEQWWEKM